MTQKNPYQIVLHRYTTEKSVMLEGLKNAESNASLKRCNSPKYVFRVDRSASKQEIAKALEEIYSDRDIKVVAVNTINVKRKPRRIRGRLGYKKAFKKAIVTLRANDSLENV
jgi:large subunit ribosomal protein L23